jgi:hypothetical protein
VAVTVTRVDVPTDPAVIVKVPEVAPGPSVTTAGRVSPAGELERVITAPRDPAGLVSVTVPVAEPPVATALGATVKLDRLAPGGFNIAVAVWLTPRKEAVTVIGVDVDTVPAPTGKVAEVAPCATVTLAGIVSPAGELDKLTATPPEGAALLSVTVPVADPPLEITPGVTVTLDSSPPVGFTVREAVLFTPR